ncbi:hypothetical protein [Chryseobacterium aureum]|uniref:hypothetical protein n=1 Tax=Chryseobacterium aureum TaxID=2497456 RepID=UPI000F88BCE8|nr:hypothetical protein [Chryseobacterium aureum]
MTKEDKIKDAYGEYYIKDNIDEDGWSNTVAQGILNAIPCDAKEMLIVYGNPEWWYRPKSLHGIENNNGWIKIESEEDLPKESCNYWIMQSDNRIQTMKEYDDNKKYFNITATHYQPIEKPKPPLY